MPSSMDFDLVGKEIRCRCAESEEIVCDVAGKTEVCVCRLVREEGSDQVALGRLPNKPQTLTLGPTQTSLQTEELRTYEAAILIL